MDVIQKNPISLMNFFNKTQRANATKPRASETIYFNHQDRAEYVITDFFHVHGLHVHGTARRRRERLRPAAGRRPLPDRRPQGHNKGRTQ